MFAAEIPTMPQPMIDLATANPEGFAEAMGSGMEAMTAALEGGASPGDAFEAMGDVMGPMMEEMGVSPEAFDAMGDAFGATMGPAMHMAPADATGDDMGAIMQDGLDMMMPPGVDVPPVITEAMGDLGATMGESGMSAHDVASEMMGAPGDETYMLPVDGDGNAVVEAGQPETCPAEAVQPPPADGACASTEGMMPPEGGHDHAPVTVDMVMAEPYDALTADGGPMAGGTGGMAGGSGAGGSGTGGGAGGTGGMAGGSGAGGSGTGGGAGGTGGMAGGSGAGGSGGLSALGDAVGGTGGMAGGSGTMGGDVDAAISGAIDGAQEQGGGNTTIENEFATSDDQPAVNDADADADDGSSSMG
jgi:hypothetical protein